MIRKTQKDNNLLKTKGMVKPKYKVSWRPVFTFSLPGGNSPLCPPSVTPLAMIYRNYIE